MEPPPAVVFLPEEGEVRRLRTAGGCSGCASGLPVGYLLLLAVALNLPPDQATWLTGTLLLLASCLPSLALSLWSRRGAAEREAKRRREAGREVSAWLAANGLRAEAVCSAAIFGSVVTPGHLVAADSGIYFIRERGRERALARLGDRTTRPEPVGQLQARGWLMRALWALSGPTEAIRIGVTEVASARLERFLAWLETAPASEGPSAPEVEVETGEELAWRELTPPESWERSRWRAIPAWLLAGLVGSVSWIVFMLAVASPGAAALLTLLLVASARLEQGLRVLPLWQRWLGALALICPTILVGLAALQAQAGFAAASAGGAPWSKALSEGSAALQIQTWEEALPAMMGAILFLTLSGARVRLLPRRVTGVLAALAVLPLLGLVVGLIDFQAGTAFVSLGGSGDSGVFMLMLVVLPLCVPAGLFAAGCSAYVEALVQWLVLRDERHQAPRLDTLHKELVDALREGRLPPWATLDP